LSSALRESTTRRPFSETSSTLKWWTWPMELLAVADRAEVHLGERAEPADAAQDDLEAARVRALDLALDRRASSLAFIRIARPASWRRTASWSVIWPSSEAIVASIGSPSLTLRLPSHP